MNSSPPSGSSARPSTLKAWLELLRAPNLLTVPGDPLAGFCLAAVFVDADLPVYLWPGLLAGLVSLLLYAGGLIDNDLCDLNEDRRDHPARPLASGRINPRLARCVCVGLFIAALCLTGLGSLLVQKAIPLYMAAGILLCVLLYNRVKKSLPPAGIILMGLCRGGSFLLGASVWGWSAVTLPLVVYCAAGWTLYIAAVTVLASGEVRAGVSQLGRWLPTITAGAWGATMVVALGPSRAINHPAFLVIFACGVIMTAWPAVRLGLAAPPKQIQKSIGWWIRNLLLIQAACCFAFPSGRWLGVALLAAWPVSAILSRRFYAS